MAEEVHNPSVELPRAIALSIPIGAIFGLFFLLPIVFTLPDVTTLLAGKFLNNFGGFNWLKIAKVTTGQPIGLMFELAMGSKGGGFGLWFISS